MTWSSGLRAAASIVLTACCVVAVACGGDSDTDCCIPPTPTLDPAGATPAEREWVAAVCPLVIAEATGLAAIPGPTADTSTMTVRRDLRY